MQVTLSKPTSPITRCFVIAVSMLTLGLAGCGAGARSVDEVSAGVDACFAQGPGFRTGIYGCVTTTIGGYTSENDNFRINIYQSAQRPDANTPAIITTRTNAIGYYEIDLIPGSYWICSRSFECKSFGVGNLELLELDFRTETPNGW
jgi:hypothetical protein